jgi:four helix bundle protein
MTSVVSYKDLLVWQKSMNLVAEIYKVTEKYPKHEIYGITSQTRRSAVSIPSNIAEGRRRNGKKEFSYFLKVAYGSACELETHILIAEKLLYVGSEHSASVTFSVNEIIKMLGKMISSLRE